MTFVDSLINAFYPDRKIRIVNVGTSGNTVRDLAARWQNDVLDLKPDWLSVMIGTNDVWRQFDTPRIVENQVHPEEYERTYAELLTQTRPLLKGLVLMTPFYIEPNKSDAMRETMDAYGQIVRRLAKQFDAIFVDTQAEFDRVLAHQYSASLSWDRVHPNQTGHMLLAKAFLDGVGFEWKSGTA